MASFDFKREAEEVPEDDWNKESKEFRCPFRWMVAKLKTVIIDNTHTFRTEKGAVCGVYQGRLNEVLNHFYR